MRIEVEASTEILPTRQYASPGSFMLRKTSVYSLTKQDATIFDLCLSVFPRAKFRQSKRAVKLCTLLDLRGTIHTFVSIADEKVLEVNILERLVPEIGAIYIMDRGCLDFERLYALIRRPHFLSFVSNQIPA